VHTIIITLMALLALGLVGPGSKHSTATSTSPAPHARVPMDIIGGGGPS
jgi:hypothetical protein